MTIPSPTPGQIPDPMASTAAPPMPAVSPATPMTANPPGPALPAPAPSTSSAFAPARTPAPAGGAVAVPVPTPDPVSPPAPTSMGHPNQPPF